MGKQLKIKQFILFYFSKKGLIVLIIKFQFILGIYIKIAIYKTL